jgi:transcriptional regulator with XRE-family HTH domain
MSIDKIKQKLFQNSFKDSGWLEKAKWRQENQDWLDISFAVAVKILSALNANKKANVAPKNQIELAASMGCSAQYVNKLLRGQENLQIETICKVQRILGIKLIEVPKAISVTVQYNAVNSWLENTNIKSPAINKTSTYTTTEVEIIASSGEGNFALAA